jgi:hypothetical protein
LIFALAVCGCGGAGRATVGPAASDGEAARPTIEGAPARDVVISGARQVDAGKGIGCAALLDGGVRCFWRTSAGWQLRDVGLDIQAVEVAVGTFLACARSAAGEARCWSVAPGRSGFEPSSPWAPLDAPEMTAIYVADWPRVACGVTAQSAVVCWSDAASAPRAVDGLYHATSLALSIGSCAARLDGSVVCWGPDIDDGPLEVVPLVTSAEQVEGTPWYHCARQGQGDVLCWGSVLPGGGDASPDRAVPLALPEQARSIAGGAGYLCALSRAGRVRCVGREEVRIPPEAGPFDAITAADHLACALRGAEVRCWGEGIEFGETGRNGAPMACVTRADSRGCWGG